MELSALEANGIQNRFWSDPYGAAFRWWFEICLFKFVKCVSYVEYKIFIFVRYSISPEKGGWILKAGGQLLNV